MTRVRFRIAGKDFNSLRTHLPNSGVIVESYTGFFCVEGGEGQIKALLQKAGFESDDKRLTYEDPVYMAIEEHSAAIDRLTKAHR